MVPGRDVVRVRRPCRGRGPVDRPHRTRCLVGTVRPGPARGDPQPHRPAGETLAVATRTCGGLPAAPT